MNNYKIGILTSNMLRHRYMVNTLSDEFDIDFIISEEKTNSFNHRNFAKNKSFFIRESYDKF